MERRAHVLFDSLKQLQLLRVKLSRALGKNLQSRGGQTMVNTMDEISFSNMSRLLERRVPQRPVRYHAIPRFVVESIMLQRRSLPDNLSNGPHRPPSRMSRPPALGLESIKGLKEKKKKETSQQPSSVLPPIKERNEMLFPKEIACVGADVNEEELLALSTHEKNADLVRYRAVRYEPEPDIWQKVACTWDQFQTRPNQFHQYESDRLFPAISTSTVRLEEKEKLKVEEPHVEEPITMPKMETTKEKKIRFTRPTPGYGGYISRYPVEPRPPQGSWDEVFVNFSKLTYRSYPSYEYTNKEFAHKGPLSRLVTTTQPSNPFNKVDQWNSRQKKLWKRATHSKFV